MARLVTVMPTWAPESWVDSDRSALCSPWAPRVAGRGVLLDLRAVDGDEGELGRDEDAARRDEREREREQQQGGRHGAEKSVMRASRCWMRRHRWWRRLQPRPRWLRRSRSVPQPCGTRPATSRRADQASRSIPHSSLACLLMLSPAFSNSSVPSSWISVIGRLERVHVDVVGHLAALEVGDVLVVEAGLLERLEDLVEAVGQGLPVVLDLVGRLVASSCILSAVFSRLLRSPPSMRVELLLGRLEVVAVVAAVGTARRRVVTAGGEQAEAEGRRGRGGKDALHKCLLWSGSGSS